MADASEGRLVRVSHVDAATAAAIMAPAGGDEGDTAAGVAAAAAYHNANGSAPVPPGTCEGVFVKGVCTITPRAKFCCRYYTGDDSDAFNGGFEPGNGGGYGEAHVQALPRADTQGAAAAAAAARLAGADGYYSSSYGRQSSHAWNCWQEGGY
jgi:hypothetical protein